MWKETINVGPSFPVAWQKQVTKLGEDRMRDSGEREPVEIEGIVKAVTDKAVLLTLDDDTEEWIPKSQIEDCDVDVDDLEKGDKIRIEIPAWLAEEKGL